MARPQGLRDHASSVGKMFAPAKETIEPLNQCSHVWGSSVSWTKPGSCPTFLAQVLDVTSFLSEHPGGELAILTFAGKDATEEFNMCLGT